MSTPRAERLRLYVELRANLRCEYCHRPQPITGLVFHIEHIIPRAEGGKNELENLALACPTCNYKKADRTAGWDPKTKKTVSLFSPRVHRWSDHFRWSHDRQRIIGQTDQGRATIQALDLNHRTHQAFRQLWKQRFQDLFPFDE